jgi:hypothetical protein
MACAALLAGTFCLVSLPASAEPTPADRETARAMVLDGRAKMQKQDYAGALRSFQAAHDTMGVPTTGLDLAKAQVALGLLIEARDLLLKVTRLPAAANEPEAFSNARIEAGELAQSLAGRIPSLIVIIKGPPADTPVKLTIDGATIPTSALRLPRKINPGPHKLAASAPGFEAREVAVAVLEGTTRPFEVALNAIGAAASGPAPATAVAPVEQPAALPDSSSRSIAPWIVGGVGVAGLAVGGILGAVVLGEKSTTDKECNQVTLKCPADAVSAANTGRTLGPISTVGFIVGGLGVGVSAVWLLTRGPAKGEAPATVGMGPAVTASGAGWRLQGTW